VAVVLVNRRYLRIKVFQGLYSFFRTPKADPVKVEREIFESINRLFNLYLYLLKLVLALHDAADEIIEQNRQKRLPTEEDLNPNMRFVNNRVFAKIAGNVMFQRIIERQKINWDNEHDDLRRIYKALREDEKFEAYRNAEEDSLQADKDILEYIFKEYLAVNEVFHNTLEEADIYWQDDLPVAALTVIKTIQALPDADTTNSSILADLYKEKDEDQKFVKELLSKTIQFSDEYGEHVADKADNWEVDRIAFLDMLLMKMALAELEHFPTIPIKVTLNEYIELAKMYSTPKSKVFINGVLDKLVAHFKRLERINKRGRGLIE